MARWFRRGVTKIRLLPTIAATVSVNNVTIVGSPTNAEWLAGTDLTPQVGEMSGWQLSNSPITTPNLVDKFTPQIEGEDTVGDSSITFYDDDASAVLRTALTKGTAGFICIAHYGETDGERMAVFPVKTTGDNDEVSVGNDPARYVVTFAITATPNIHAAFSAT